MISCRKGRDRGNTHGMVPQSRAPPVLFTRPRAQGDRFAADLRAVLGPVAVVTSPLLRPVVLHPDRPEGGPWRGVILTSETGAAAASPHLRGWDLPVAAHCVGARTAAAAQEGGFSPDTVAPDAEALIAALRGTAGPLLHLRGREARGDIAARLTALGTRTDEVVVYAQEAGTLTDEARALLAGAGPVLVPLFSPRTAAILAGQGPFAAALWVAALSPAVAERAAALLPARMAVAARPDAGGMLAAVRHLAGTGGASPA